MDAGKFTFLSGNSSSKERNKNWDFEEKYMLLSCVFAAVVWGYNIEKAQKAALNCFSSCLRPACLQSTELTHFSWGHGIGCGPDIIPSLF